LFIIFRAAEEVNVAQHGRRTPDRRIEKTRGLLHEALASLVREKPYDSIVVKEILDRANVGRSTFYMHFRDKDDLLASSIHDTVRSAHASARPSSGSKHERIVGFSLPVFEHIHQHRSAGAAKMGSKGRAILHEHLRQVLADLIGDEVKRGFAGRRKTPGQMPPDLLVRYVASSFILVLNWWVEESSPLAPADVDAVFRALVMPTLAVVLP